MRQILNIGWEAERTKRGLNKIGAFIGEFVSSNAGLGHLILVASGLFDISLVLCGVLLLSGLAFILYFFVGQLEPWLKRVVVSYL